MRPQNIASERGIVGTRSAESLELESNGPVQSPIQGATLGKRLFLSEERFYTGIEHVGFGFIRRCWGRNDRLKFPAVDDIGGSITAVPVCRRSLRGNAIQVHFTIDERG